MCEKENIIPEDHLKVLLVMRVGESLHEKAAIAAIDRGIKLNEFVRQAIEHELRA